MADWLTVEEIAAEVRVSRETVRRWVRKGLLKGVKLGKQYRIDREVFNAWLEKGREGE